MATIIASNIFSVNDMKDGIAEAWIATKNPEEVYSVIKTNTGSGSILVTVVNDVVTNRPHKYKWVDEGLMFRQAYLWEVASGEVAYMLVKVGSKYPHMLFQAQANGDVQIEIFHSPTVTLDGDPEPTGNFNFNSGNTSLTTWFPDPTIGADGTYIANTWIFGGSGVGTPAASITSASIFDFDTILIPNVEFLLKFTNHAERDVKVFLENVYAEWENDYS